jgi:hypothetical protein
VRQQLKALLEAAAASGELRLAPALETRVGWSTIRPWPESASFPASKARGGSRSRGICGQELSWALP